MAKIIGSPSRYIQAKGTVRHLTEYTEAYGKKLLILTTDSGKKRVGDAVEASAKETGSEIEWVFFGRECSKSEVERVLAVAREKGSDVVVGIGGGKTLDTAKAVAYYAKLPVVIVPTIASTDAPCSALSVLYTDDGVFDEYLFLPANPNAVIMDSDVVANAPARLLVSGMGDALATYFEARACMKSGAGNCVGGTCSLSAMALAELCYRTLLSDGLKAKVAVEKKVATKAVENIIEANTYLSGIGFESGGLAGAHAIHNGLTCIPACHKMYHGEKVAFGTITQLVLENADIEELEEVIGFCLEVGLPVTLEDLGIKEFTKDEIMQVATIASADTDTIHNMPFPVDAEAVYDAIIAADNLGHYYKDEI